MNLLTDAWIPVQHQGSYQKISLQQLLCGEQLGELCLPRDDMELACLQLLCAMTQVLFIPRDKKALGQYIKDPITPEAYADACRGKMDWFDLDHPETPFMQIRGVKAAQPTTMDKLLAGVADGTNKAFVNPQGLGTGLCESCTAIALFNMANNAPSVGGGFQGSFRGNTPITIMIKGKELRDTIWLNILTEENIVKIMPWYEDTKYQKPNYVDKETVGASLNASMIGLNRGLLWQPAHYELCPSINDVICSCCGCAGAVYLNFKKEKFKYTMIGYWPHPLSPSKYGFDSAGGRIDVRFDSFTTSAPAWTHLSSFLYVNNNTKEGSSPAPVIDQIRSLLNSKALNIVVGGYRYKPPQTATITDRRHDLFSLAHGWDKNEATVKELINTAIEYKKVLRKGLYSFISRAIINPGSKKNKDRIGEICAIAEAVYYQQSENLIHHSLVAIDFEAPQNELQALNQQLKTIVISLFNQSTEPYHQEPKMLKALALARRSLHKFLKELEPQGETHE